MKSTYYNSTPVCLQRTPSVLTCGSNNYDNKTDCSEVFLLVGIFQQQNKTSTMIEENNIYVWHWNALAREHDEPKEDSNLSQWKRFGFVTLH